MPAPHASADKPSARAVALELLAAVLRRGRFLDEAIEHHRGFVALAARDRAFCRNLTATTLRRLGQIDAMIEHCLERPLPARAARARDILRLGVAQLVFLSVPSHAAVDEAVRLAKGVTAGKHMALVNALLRRLSREGAALSTAQDAARLNTPDWLWQIWAQTYGDETCRKIAAAHLGEPPLDITVKRDPARWAARLGGIVLPTGSVRRALAGSITDLPGYSDGAWWVQDAAAALPVALLGTVAGLRVLDLCAAPGGKTAQLAAHGARVTAVDRSEGRMRRMAANLSRLGLAADLVVADATKWRPREPVDAVLLDAPCTGTGAIRRHPDIPHLKRPDDVERMTLVQDALLAAAVDMVRPSGHLIYCTCSLEPAEGSDRVARLLARGAPVLRRSVTPSDVAERAELITPGGDLRTLPCHLAAQGGLDGFYAARLKRM